MSEQKGEFVSLSSQLRPDQLASFRSYRDHEEDHLSESSDTEPLRAEPVTPNIEEEPQPDESISREAVSGKMIGAARVLVPMRPGRTDLRFTGQEITEFLDDFNRQAENGGLNTDERLRILPDFCDSIRRTFIKKMRPYQERNWESLQETMKEHWRDQDTAQRMGTRAFLDAYVTEAARKFPGISDYYTNFIVYSDACTRARQIHETELGFFFFRGLPRGDKEKVLMDMPNGPEGDSIQTYRLEEIYKYVRHLHRQREGIKQMSTRQAEQEARDARRLLEGARKPIVADAKAAIEEIRAQTRAEATRPRIPHNVDPEVQELVEAIGNMKISLAEVDKMMQHHSIEPLLRAPANYAYFISHATRNGNVQERNDGSYITKAPQNLDPRRGTTVYQGREYRNTCNMCNELNHQARDCELYNTLIRLGWISFEYDQTTGRKSYHYGPRHKRLGEVAGPIPQSLQYQWLKQRIREFFEVTDDVLDQPASSVKPEHFGGVDSRPVRNRPWNPSGAPQRTIGNANTITANQGQNARANPQEDLAEFQSRRMVDLRQDGMVNALDWIDSQDIVLGAYASGDVNSAGISAAVTRPLDKSGPGIDHVLERARNDSVHRAAPRAQGRTILANPKRPYIRARESPAVRTTSGPNREDAGSEADELQGDLISKRYVRQAHEEPFSIVKPPLQSQSMPHISAEPELLSQGKKKKVQFESLGNEELKELLRQNPNRMATAMLKQEVRGITIADLFSQDKLRDQIKGLITGMGSSNSQGGQDGDGVAVNEVRTWVEGSGQSEDARSRLATRRPVIGSANQTLNERRTDHYGYPAPAQDAKTEASQHHEGFRAACNIGTVYVAQAQHEVPGTYDTWDESLDLVTQEEASIKERVSNLAFIQSELPTCWASFNEHAVKCLIDTGSQMNLLRLSAAKALGLTYELMAQEPGRMEGVVTANGTVDAFVGTAWNVPVRVGEVIISAHFRIVANLTRSVILGGPWCASSRLSIQYNVYGRVTCRILSNDGSRNAVFLASDPSPHHPNHMVVNKSEKLARCALVEVTHPALGNFCIGVGECSAAGTIAYVKHIQEAAYVEERRGFGSFSPVFTREDRKDLRKWANQVIETSVYLTEDPATPRELSHFSIMCELNRQAGREEMWKPGPRERTLSGVVATLYKKAADKVRPVDQPRDPGEMEFGREDWKEIAKENQLLRLSIREPDLGPFDHLFEKRYAAFPRGTRLTPERLKEQKFGAQLSSQEVALFKEMLLNREGAIAFTFPESGRITKDVCPPYKIRTIPHQAWQVKGFPIAKEIEEECVRMLNDRLDRGVLERCDSQYRNPWHLVAKKDNTHRMINNAQHMNRVSIRDANLPPSADEFSERFAGCTVISLMDLFSGYDQITLHPDSRDMTAFHTPIGLLRNCTLVQGATNSVAAFQRVVTKILKDHWPHTLPFMDDITAGGPKTSYNNEESLPGIRRFVLEHIMQLDRVLADIERAGATISGKKSYWGMTRLGVVGYEVGTEGRYPDSRKVEKIVNWPECRNPKEVRMFVGICVYYRIWVIAFAIVARPLFQLLRDEAVWEWGEPQRKSMSRLKKSITEAPALITPSSEHGGMLFVSVDASKEGGGAALEQIGPDGKRHPCRFESTLWSKAESSWHSTKLECKAVLWALKKFRIWLYGRKFTIETDAQTLIAQLNRSSTDVPGSIMNRWLGAILMWDFEIKHVPGKKNVVADALSRYPKPEGWEAPEEGEDDLEDFIENLIANIETKAPDVPGRCLNNEYGEESEAIAQFLTTFKKPVKMSRKEGRAWTKKAMNFFVRGGYLFRKTSRNVAIRRVIDDQDLQAAAIWDVHRQIGHRGVNGVYSILAQRYWWDNMYSDVRLRLSACGDCQFRSSKRMVDMLTNTYSYAIWECIAMDVVYMPHSQGKKFIVIARDYLSGWPEARALSNNRSETIAKFIYEDIICRWSMTRRLMVDGGPDFAKVVTILAKVYHIKRVQSSGHNPQAMGKIEGGHKPIVNALAKLTGSWVDNLPTVLMADRISIQENTGYSPYQLVTGQNPVLPIELALPTWQTLPFRTIQTREQLLAVRAMQIDLRDQFMEEAVTRTERLRQAKKEYWDNTKEIRQYEIQAGDLVLLWNSIREIDMSRDRKLEARWLGPYRVHSASVERGTYRLEELDGALFAHTTPGWRLKRFIQRSEEDIAQEDRGRMKLWEPELWMHMHNFRDPPAQFDQLGTASGIYEDSDQVEDPQERQLRQLESRHPANRAPVQAVTEEQHSNTRVAIVPRQLSQQERSEYITYDDSSGTSSEDE